MHAYIRTYEGLFCLKKAVKTTDVLSYQFGNALYQRSSCRSSASEQADRLQRLSQLLQMVWATVILSALSAWLQPILFSLAGVALWEWSSVLPLERAEIVCCNTSCSSRSFSAGALPGCWELFCWVVFVWHSLTPLCFALAGTWDTAVSQYSSFVDTAGLCMLTAAFHIYCHGGS